MTDERSQEIKALLECHSTHKEQFMSEFPMFPSVSLTELQEVKPIAYKISDRYYFAVCGAISRKERQDIVDPGLCVVNGSYAQRSFPVEDY